MVRRRELILNARIMRGILRCSGNAHYPQGAPCSGFGYRIRQAVCKLRVCLCTSTFDAGISAPRWAQIGNVCVSFHAVSIHTEKVPRLPVVLPRRPHADIGTCSIRRCDGQALDIACRQEIRNTHDYSGIGNCPSQRRILEPVSGIEPEYSAWKADVLPLNYTGMPRPTIAGRVGKNRRE